MEEFKICITCNNSKVLTEFFRQKKSRGGRRAQCKECYNKKHKEYKSRNRSKINEWKRNHRASRTPEQKKEANRIHREYCRKWEARQPPSWRAKKSEVQRKRRAKMSPEQKEKELEHNRKRRSQRSREQKEKDRQYNRKWYLSQPKEYKVAVRIRMKEYYDNLTKEEKQKRFEYSRTYYANMTNEQKEKRREWSRKRLTNISFRIRDRLSNRIYCALRGESKSGRTDKLLGCSIPFFKAYIENQFTKRMSWQTWGSYWHLDHIIPCFSFDLSQPEEQKRCFNYTNMRPLPAKKNISKRDKMPSKVQFRFL